MRNVSGHKVDAVAPTVVDARASADRTKIVLAMSEPMGTTLPSGAGGFTVNVVSGTAPTVSSVALDSGDARKVVLTLSGALDASKAYTLDYDADGVTNPLKDVPGMPLQNFEGRTVGLIAPTWEFSVTGTETDAIGNWKVVEGGATVTAKARITNAARFASAQTITLFWDGKPLRGASGSGHPGNLLEGAGGATAITLPANASEATLELGAHDDNRYRTDFAAMLTARLGSDAVGSAVTLVYGDNDPIPSVTGIEITSDPNDDGRPGDDDTYAWGDEVSVTVTFSAPVDVLVSDPSEPTDSSSRVS